MKKTQIWIAAILFCISFFNTVIADNEPNDTFKDNASNNKEISVQSLNIHLSKAKIFVKNNKEDLALKELEKILELDPNNEKALELKTQIIGESLPEKEELKNNLEEENSEAIIPNNSDNNIDYMQLAKNNWPILAILVGSFLAIVIILVFGKIKKNKNNNSNYENYDASNKDEKDAFSELEDVF